MPMASPPNQPALIMLSSQVVSAKPARPSGAGLENFACVVASLIVVFPRWSDGGAGCRVQPARRAIHAPRTGSCRRGRARWRGTEAERRLRRPRSEVVQRAHADLVAAGGPGVRAVGRAVEPAVQPFDAELVAAGRVVQVQPGLAAAQQAGSAVAHPTDHVVAVELAGRVECIEAPVRREVVAGLQVAAGILDVAELREVAEHLAETLAGIGIRAEHPRAGLPLAAQLVAH